MTGHACTRMREKKNCYYQTVISLTGSRDSLTHWERTGNVVRRQHSIVCLLCYVWGGRQIFFFFRVSGWQWSHLVTGKMIWRRIALRAKPLVGQSFRSSLQQPWEMFIQLLFSRSAPQPTGHAVTYTSTKPFRVTKHTVTQGYCANVMPFYISQ